ncbi:site-2 protease family protein [bacterium]|nr:site-2 protease family protein [bacterium]
MHGNVNIPALALVLCGWIFSVCVHEFSHALIAYLGGDRSVRESGYLTFNPLRYTHISTSIVYPLVFLLLGGIGLPGGAVYINRNALRNRIWESAVSLAGPFSSALLFCAMMIPFRYGIAGPGLHPVFWSAYAFLCYCQLTAVLFNLLPIPPLDGFGALASFMHRKVRLYLYKRSQVIFLALIIVMFYVKPVGNAYWHFIGYIAEKAGLPFGLVFNGLHLVRIAVFGS